MKPPIPWSRHAFFSGTRRLKKCPSDKVMVIFGSVWFRGGTGQHAARCLHGGTAFIWPVIQDYGFLSLRPIQLEVNLRNALCKQTMNRAAYSPTTERLLWRIIPPNW